MTTITITIIAAITMPIFFMPIIPCIFIVCFCVPSVVFLIRFIPHFGHCPGNSLIIPGCIEHVYNIFSGVWAESFISFCEKTCTEKRRVAKIDNILNVFIVHDFDNNDITEMPKARQCIARLKQKRNLKSGKRSYADTQRCPNQGAGHD